MPGYPVLLAAAARELGRTVVDIRQLVEAGSVQTHDINGRRGVLVEDVREALSAANAVEEPATPDPGPVEEGPPPPPQEVLQQEDDASRPKPRFKPKRGRN